MNHPEKYGISAQTIPAQLEEALSLLDQAHAQIAASADAREVARLTRQRDEASAECNRLRSENADLRAKLAAADVATGDFNASVEREVAKRTAEIEARLNADFEQKANARAGEIMASVGQPAPLAAFTANGREDTTASGLSGVAAVEASYRGKYEGKGKGWDEE